MKSTESTPNAVSIILIALEGGNMNYCFVVKGLVLSDETMRRQADQVPYQ